MKKYAAILCLSLFVSGVLVAPVLHKEGSCISHCKCDTGTPHNEHDREEETPASDDSTHDADNCAICQLAATALIASCGAVQTIAPRPTTAPLLLANTRTSSRLNPGSFLARAPPLLSSI